MRTLRAFAICLCIFVTGCDTSIVEPEDSASPLAYFAAETDVVARVDAGATSGLLGEGTSDVSEILDSLGLQPGDVQAAYASAALQDETAPTDDSDVQVVITTRLPADALRQRVREAAGEAGRAYGAATIYTGADQGALAVLGGDLLAARSETAVRAMIDRAEGRGASLEDDADVVRLAGRLDGFVAGFVARDALDLLGLALGDSLGAVLPAALPVESGALAMPTPEVENGGAPTSIALVLWLQPTASTTAQGLVGVLNAAKTLVVSSPSTDPETVQIFSSMQLHTDGPDVRVDVEIPVDLLLDDLISSR